MRSLQYVGMPIVTAYFDLKESVFLNTVHPNANEMTQIGNICLGSYHYLFNGQRYDPLTKKFQSIFQYNHSSFVEILKTLVAIFLLPLSLLLGCLFKAVGQLTTQNKENHFDVPQFANQQNSSEMMVMIRTKTRHSRPSTKLTAKQRQELDTLFQNGLLDETHQQEIAALPEAMQTDLIALKDLVDTLNSHNIAFWLSSGSLLGVYRHEGIIPWDHDIDIAILSEDHENVKNSFRGNSKYRILDWSPADQPGSFLKLYVFKTRSLIDIYHYKKQTNAETGAAELVYQSPHVNKWYMPEMFRIRELPWLAPEPMSRFFPLKRGLFDGIIVGIPADMESHLKHGYGNRLDPAKVWNESKKSYVNVKGHPYWEKSEV
jgi:hypothetical protein